MPSVQAGESGGTDIMAGIFPDLDEARLPAVAAMHERGPKCFDVGYYRSHNPDLHQAATATEEQLWAHFLHFGQFERRPFRCGCCSGLPASRGAHQPAASHAASGLGSPVC